MFHKCTDFQGTCHLFCGTGVGHASKPAWGVRGGGVVGEVGGIGSVGANKLYSFLLSKKYIFLVTDDPRDVID